MSGRLHAFFHSNSFSWLNKPLWRVFLVMAMAMAIGWIPDFRNWSDHRVFDAYTTYQPRPYDPNVPVRIITIDEESLARIGQWPWPRNLLAELVDRLAQMNVRVVALDMFFPEPDRLSPDRVFALWRKAASQWQPALELSDDSTQGMPDFDRMLADSFAGVPVVIGFSFGQANAQRSAKVLALDKALPSVSMPASKAVVSVPTLAAAAFAEAPVVAAPDPDGIIRRLPLWLGLSGETAASLALAATLAWHGDENGLQVKPADSYFSAAPRIYRGDQRLRVSDQGDLVFWDTGPFDLRYIPAWQLLAKNHDEFLWEASDFTDALVFVGVTATGLHDQQWGPSGRIIPGVELHAQIAEQLLLDQQLYTPPAAEWIAPLAGVFLAFALVWLCLEKSRILVAWLFFGGLCLASAGLGLWWFDQKQWLVNPVIPATQWFAALLLASGLRYAGISAEKRALSRTFSHYLSPDRVNQLISHPEQLSLGGETRAMTLMFSDVRNFTALSERLDAESLINLMNNFLTPLSDAIMAHQGCIDKYMGDCIMAFWNAPLNDGQHPRNACRAAIAMEQALVRFNEAQAQLNGPCELRIGIGMNTGQCCVGNMGSRQRFDYSVIGDSVNLASRLEGLSGYYGVTTVVGEATAKHVNDWALLELDLVRVKGKNEPVQVFTLLGDEHIALEPGYQDLHEKHAAFLAAYRGQHWEAAEQCVRAIEPLVAIQWPQLQGLYSLYAARLQHYREQPPGPDWDGVHDMQNK